MALTEEKRGQIALASLRLKFRRSGMNITPENIAQAIQEIHVASGVSASEAKDFLREIVDDLVEMSFKDPESE